MPKLVKIKDLEKKIGLKNIKDPKYNQSNELLIFKTNNKLNLTKKRVIDFIFYSVKQKLIIENIKEINNYIEISIPLKNLYVALGSEKTNNYEGYKGYLIHLLSELNNTKILKINLVKTPIEIKDEKEFLKNIKDNELKSYSQKDIIGDFDIINNIVTIFVGKMIGQQLLKNNNYTKFNYLVNNFLKSTYSINLYHYLIASFQAQIALIKKGKIEKKDVIQTAFVEINKFYEIMDAENTKLSESFSRFNDRILKRAVKELNETKVVEFEIIEVLKKKNGRKIIKLAFLLKPRENYYYPLFDKENNKIFLTKYDDYCNLDLKNKIDSNNDDIDTKVEKKVNNAIIKNTYPVISTPTIPTTAIENNNNNQKYFISSKIIELKNQIINKTLPYYLFKRKLMQIQDSYICNNVNGRLEHLILKTSNIGHLELFNPDTNEIISLTDLKDVEKIRIWLYNNPDKLGDIQKIDVELSKFKNIFENKYIINKHNRDNRNHYSIIYIKEVLRIENNKLIASTDELIENRQNLEVKILKDLDKNLLLSNLEKNQIEDYRQFNAKEELKELTDFFINNKDKVENYLFYLDKEYQRLTQEFLDEDKDNEKEINILLTKIEKISEFLEDSNTILITYKNYLKEFKEFCGK